MTDRMDEAAAVAHKVYRAERIYADEKRAMRSALAAALPYMRAEVKKLEWRQAKGYPVDHWVFSEASGLTYSAFFQRGEKYRSAVAGKTIGDFDTLEAAKAAAQADYERRILSALSHKGGDRG